MSKCKRIPASQTHKEVVEEWKTDPVFKARYDALETKYQQLRDVLKKKENR
jgi:hypothetical protein